MRRALALVLVPAAAHAAPWAITLEGGAEADTNVERVETGGDLDVQPIAAPVERLGGRVEHRDHLAGGTYSLAVSALMRYVDDSNASVENVALVTGDVRWVHPVGDRPVSLGFALTAADALPLTDPIGDRTFRNLGADGLVVMRAEDRVLTLALGVRQFVYKPIIDHSFDWVGPVASARLDLTLWESADHTRTLELAGSAGFEARAYQGNADANACMDVTSSPSCIAPTSLPRHDRYQRVGVELTYTGGFVIAGGYQLSVIDSNSFGQSLVRHRATVSATTELPLGLFVTGTVILQIDQYLDGLITEDDLQHTEVTSLSDENRSSIQLRLARPVSPTWSIEARGAIWRDLGDTMGTEFHRELVYLGAIYSSSR